MSQSQEPVVLLPCPFCGEPGGRVPGSGKLMPTLEETLAQMPNIRCSNGQCGARYCPGGFLFEEWQNRRVVPAVDPARSGAASVVAGRILSPLSGGAEAAELLHRADELGEAEADHLMNGGEHQVPRETYRKLIRDLAAFVRGRA